MKNRENKGITLVALVIMMIIIASSITVYAYTSAASDIKYVKTESDGAETEISVQNALNELYSKSNMISESGEFNQYVAAFSNYATVTINLENTYTNEDNARLLITEITSPNAMYHSTPAKIIGNKVVVTLLNFAGDGAYSKTYNVKYLVVKCPE